MEMNKPAIHLYTTDTHLPALAEICAGLEEEGVPWKLLQVEADASPIEGNAAHLDGDVVTPPPSGRRQNAPSIKKNAAHLDGDVETPLPAKELAYQAAQDSVLEVGIGLTAEAIALQIRRVPKEKPVFCFTNPTTKQCRILGTNAARAVKKQRFAEL